jgi:hypothetical protein
VRPTLAFLPVAVAITFGCAKQETFSLPLESDPFFLGSQRQVLRSDGNPTIAHYFQDESVEAVVTRMKSSGFFQALEFGRTKWFPNGAYVASMPAQNSIDGSSHGSIYSIHVFPGKQSSDQGSVEQASGATVVLVTNVKK